MQVFLCHASDDKPRVRQVYDRLQSHRWISPWLDEKRLKPGQDWNYEIRKAIRSSHAILVLLSNNSVNKAGYLQQEINYILSVADEQPDPRKIFVIPARLEDCPVPERFKALQLADLFKSSGDAALIDALKKARPPVLTPRRAAIALIAAVPVAAIVYEMTRPPDIYSVRVTVVDTDGRPVDTAQVHSSLGGEAKKVAGGWEFDIPAARKPADGALTIYAEVPASFLKGNSELRLAADSQLSVTVQLARDESKLVRGKVVDPRGNALANVRVSVTGHEAEAVATSAEGGFVLPAHAANGQQVLLHAELRGYEPVSQWHPAGSEPAVIVLSPD